MNKKFIILAAIAMVFAACEKAPNGGSTDPNTVEWKGVTYKTVTLKDGNTWMAENLRYVPEGKTVSSNPADGNGIWYPAANEAKKADPTSVEKLGLLYSAAVAFGVDTLTLENAAKFEGTQGICPTGWHIPTLTEMVGLVGHCSNTEKTNTDAPYYDATIKGAALDSLKADGFEWSFASCVARNTISNTGSYTVTNYNGIYGVMSYLIGSTFYKESYKGENVNNLQYYYFMPLYNASNSKVTVAYGNFLAGASLRCVKNK